ncbi:MAG: ornithine cyclodeaminase family protein, partial [Allosphingosinicella sp.]
ADGRLLALLDSIEVTLRRTAAATALAARFLARSESSTILVVGCGAQATAQLDALREVLPLRRAFLFDRDRPKARDLAARVAGLEASATGDLPGAAAQSDVIVGCTTARTPWLAADMVRPGTFVAAVGADSPDKNEVRPELMARARVVTDVTDQCAVMGELHQALRAEARRCDEVHAELGELVSGARPGRTDGDAITLFDSTGTALQDVAAAALIFERATVRGGVPAIDLATA